MEKEQFKKKSHMIASIKEYFVGVLALLSRLQAILTDSKQT